MQNSNSAESGELSTQAPAEHAGEGLPPLHGAPLVFLTLATALSTFMEVLDTTIANVAVPTISQ